MFLASFFINTTSLRLLPSLLQIFTFIAPAPLCFIFLSDQSVPLISVSLKGPVLVTILCKNVFFSCERMFQASVIAL